MQALSNTINVGSMPIVDVDNRSFQVCMRASALTLPAPLIFERNALYPDQQLLKGHSLYLVGKELPLTEGSPRLWTSAELTLQQDGHLVLYVTYDENKKVPIWMAPGRGVYAELNKGQLAIIRGSAYGFIREWCSDNWKEKGAYLLLEEDAGMPRLALYDFSNKIVWASNLNDGWCYDNTPW